MQMTYYELMDAIRQTPLTTAELNAVERLAAHKRKSAVRKEFTPGMVVTFTNAGQTYFGRIRTLNDKTATLYDVTRQTANGLLPDYPGGVRVPFSLMKPRTDIPVKR